LYTIPQASTIPEVSQFTNRWLIYVDNNSGFCPYSYRQTEEDGSTFQQKIHDIAATMKELKTLIYTAFCYPYHNDNASFKTYQGLYKPKSHSRQ
jgi:hypothetical protein